MAHSPVIETERLQIVSCSERYLTARYVSWLNDPDVVRYSDQRHRKHTLESCREYLESFQGTPNYLWAIVVRDPQIGHIGTLTGYVDESHSVADLGIMIGERQAWECGYGTEAWSAVCEYLFGELELRKITAGAIAPNTPMLSLMVKTGMKEDGRRIRHGVWEGEEVDVIHMAKFRDEWMRRHRR